METPEAQNENLDLEQLDEQDFQEPILIPTDSNCSRKRTLSEVSTEDEGDLDEPATVCPICNKEWTNNGIHRIVSIKCGHVFGKSCIESHIKDMFARFGSASCPLCSKSVARNDPRRVWPTKLLPSHEIELRTMRDQLDEANKDLAKLVQQNTSVKKEIDQYKLELEHLDARHSNFTASLCIKNTIQETQLPKGQFSYWDKVTFPNETYNTIDLNPNLDMAVISTYRQHRRTFGFRKVNLVDPSVTDFIPTNHKGIIRDVKHSPVGMLLSTGDDKTLKLTSTKNNLVVQSYQLDTPAAACSFDMNNANILYCGLADGTLMIYDVRNTNGHTHMLASPNNLDPIISVASNQDAVVCTDEWGSFFWLKGSEGNYHYESLDFFHKTKEIDIFGSQILSMDYNDDSFLYSMLTEQRTKYVVGHLANNPNCESKVIQQDWYFENSGVTNTSLKPRNTHFKREDNVYICYAEQDKVYLRDKEKQVQEIELNHPVLDMKHAKIGQENILATLSRQELQLFKYFK